MRGELQKQSAIPSQREQPAELLSGGYYVVIPLAAAKEAYHSTVASKEGKMCRVSWKDRPVVAVSGRDC